MGAPIRCEECGADACFYFCAAHAPKELVERRAREEAAEKAVEIAHAMIGAGVTPEQIAAVYKDMLSTKKEDRPFIVWLEGSYDSSVTNVKAIDMLAAVRDCATYVNPADPRRDMDTMWTWCACEDEWTVRGTMQPHPPPIFKRYRANARGSVALIP